MAITPYLLYRDAGAALKWLATAFGLRKSGHSFQDGTGSVTHAEMKLGDAVVLLGGPGRDFKGPKLLGHVTQKLYVDVANVAKHYARAVKAGARIVEEPKETFYGARRYAAEDLEGHVWFFAQDLAKKRSSAKKGARRKGTSRRKTKRSGKRTSRK